MASGSFCRFLDSILGQLRYEDIISYLDDGAIASATFEKHVASLDRVFARLDAAGLRLGAKKTNIPQPDMMFLGHLVN